MLPGVGDDDAWLDRAAGALVGCAVGDALGAPYEFAIPGPDQPEMRGGGIGPWAPGEWTDDTQQTICVALAAAEDGLSPGGVARRLLDWYAAGPRDVGHQTRAVLGSGAPADELEEVAAELHARRPGASAGNGSLMRTAPVALACSGDDAGILRAARAISSLTHADPVCGDACVLWSVAIDRAVREARFDGIDDALRLLPRGARATWRRVLDDAVARPPRDFVPNGYVVTALQCAWSAIQRTLDAAVSPTDHVRRALTAAIAAGHDTDTVGAIAGALLGARWGMRAIPAEWVNAVHGWPGWCADDLVALAHRIVTRA
jgi:ADP-ribosylglycohydrolase